MYGHSGIVDRTDTVTLFVKLLRPLAGGGDHFLKVCHIRCQCLTTKGCLVAIKMIITVVKKTDRVLFSMFLGLHHHHASKGSAVSHNRPGVKVLQYIYSRALGHCCCGNSTADYYLLSVVFRTCVSMRT